MPSRRTVVQFGKFLTVGTLNTAIDFGTLNLLSWLMDIYGGLRLAPINVAGVLLTLANSYLAATCLPQRNRPRTGSAGAMFLAGMMLDQPCGFGWIGRRGDNDSGSGRMLLANSRSLQSYVRVGHDKSVTLGSSGSCTNSITFGETRQRNLATRLADGGPASRVLIYLT